MAPLSFLIKSYDSIKSLYNTAAMLFSMNQTSLEPVDQLVRSYEIEAVHVPLLLEYAPVKIVYIELPKVRPFQFVNFEGLTAGVFLEEGNLLYFFVKANFACCGRKVRNSGRGYGREDNGDRELCSPTELTSFWSLIFP